MAELKHNNRTYIISDEILEKYKDLVQLILKTESMDNDERQYWFDIMPSMTEKQVARLFEILDTERKKLEALEQKYQKEIKSLNEKHLIEWQEVQMKENKEKIKQEEAQDQDENPEEILNML